MAPPLMTSRGRHWRVSSTERKIGKHLKYRVENRRNTNTAIMIGHAYLKVYPYRMFVSMSQARMHQQSTSAIARKRKITNLPLQRLKSLVVVLIESNNNSI